jgi:hypothetical protein
LTFESTGDPFDWTGTNALVTLGLTGRTTALPQGVAATAPADFVVHLAGPDRSRLLVESGYDAFAREFGDTAGLDTDTYRTGQAGFVPVREPINLGYTVPPTDERVPFDAVETGQLRFGNGNPDAAAYDSLTDVYAAPDGSTLELRLPWVLLNVADPSTKQRLRTDWADGLDVTDFDALDVGAATYAPATDGSARERSGATNLARTAPGTDGGTLQTVAYGWEPWNDPKHEERLKESYHVLRRSGWDGTL